MILENERIDSVNDSIKLIQKTDGLTFGTDALLLAAYVRKRAARGAEFGAGGGIISMLILTRGKANSVDAYEIQEEYCDLIRRNAEENGLSDKLFPRCSDVRDIPASSEYDLIFTNPPYMKTDTGKRNELDKKNIARHEVFGDISDFLLSAKKSLKFGGAFYAVYRPDRLADLIVAMREAETEPKRITFVYADTASESSMVLIEGKRGGKPGNILTPPLIIYKDRTHTEYTKDMNFILDQGVFPDKFIR